MHPDVGLTIQREIDTYSVGGEGGLDILIGGVDSKGAHIYVVGNPGISAPFDSIGYTAIGSGLSHSMATFIAKDYQDALSLNEALLIAYEAKKISEKAPGVGTRITNIAIINQNGITRFDDNDVNELDKVYENIKSSERELSVSKDWAGELNELIKKLEDKRGKKYG